MANASAQVTMLLTQLERSNRVNGARSAESRAIRLRLRKLGHRGGLRG